MDSDNTEKYSLRPRNSIKKKSKTLQDSSDEDQMGQNANNGSSNSSTDQQGQLKRVKPKPPPLSKYRRKTANARERSRMHEINVAFETLRQVVPHLANVKSSKSVAMNEKLTKITTLRLAMRYIRTLNDLLKETEHLVNTTTNHNDNNNNINNNNNNGIETPFKEKFADLGDLLSDCSELDCLLMESDGESLTLSEQSSLLASSNSPNFSDSLSSVDFDDPATLLTCNDFVDQPLSVCEFNELFLV